MVEFELAKRRADLRPLRWCSQPGGQFLRRRAMPKLNDIVLVHGGFVDGAGWRGVYDILTDHGFNVGIVQNSDCFRWPMMSLRPIGSSISMPRPRPGPCRPFLWQALSSPKRPTTPRLPRLAYITAFSSDKGESVGRAHRQIHRPARPSRRSCRRVDGLPVPRPGEIRRPPSPADVEPGGQAAFMADSQVPWGVEALERRGERSPPGRPGRAGTCKSRPTTG